MKTFMVTITLQRDGQKSCAMLGVICEKITEVFDHAIVRLHFERWEGWEPSKVEIEEFPEWKARGSVEGAEATPPGLRREE